MSDKIANSINEGLFNFYLEADKDIINQILKEEYGDTGNYEKDKKRLLFTIQATLKKSYNDNLMDLVSKFEDALSAGLERPIAILKQIIQKEPAFALYRNFEKFSKEDIIAIIKDKNLAELIDELEQSNE